MIYNGCSANDLIIQLNYKYIEKIEINNSGCFYDSKAIYKLKYKIISILEFDIVNSFLSSKTNFINIYFYN